MSSIISSKQFTPLSSQSTIEAIIRPASNSRRCYLRIINEILHNLTFNPLNAELHPICHLLALLGAHHIFHVGGLRVNIIHSKKHHIDYTYTVNMF